MYLYSKMDGLKKRGTGMSGNGLEKTGNRNQQYTKHSTQHNFHILLYVLGHSSVIDYTNYVCSRSLKEWEGDRNTDYNKRDWKERLDRKKDRVRERKSFRIRIEKYTKYKLYSVYISTMNTQYLFVFPAFELNWLFCLFLFR